jgi:hypothetical protein
VTSETRSVLFLEYAHAMQQAQLFEAALQFVAAMEIDVPAERFSDEAFERTEWFFSRPIGWLQRQLAFSSDLVREIDELRKQRNRLAHGYLVRMEFAEPDETNAGSWDPREHMPGPVRRDFDRQVVAAAEDAETARQDAVEELRTLTLRFKECNGQLYARSLSRLPHFETWEEVEEHVRAQQDPPPRGDAGGT